MKTKYIASDYHGSVSRKKTETYYMSKLGFGLLGYHIKNRDLWDSLKLSKIAAVDLALGGILPYKLKLLSEPKFEEVMYRRFQKALKGEDYNLISALTWEIAKGAPERLRGDALEAFRKFHENGGDIRVISTGCKEKIDMELEYAGYRDVIPPKNVVANTFDLEAKDVGYDEMLVKGFNNTGVNVAKELERYMEGKDPERVGVLLHDYRGEEMAGKAKERGGRVIVPHWAKPDFREKAREELNAELPTNTHEFRKLILE